MDPRGRADLHKLVVSRTRYFELDSMTEHLKHSNCNVTGIVNSIQRDPVIGGPLLIRRWGVERSLSARETAKCTLPQTGMGWFGTIAGEFLGWMVVLSLTIAGESLRFMNSKISPFSESG